MKRDEIGNLDNGNRFNVFLRAAVGIVFLYLNFAAYELIGIEGVVITSVFFLVAQFAPFFVRAFGRIRRARTKQLPKILVEPEVEHKSDTDDRIRLVSQVEKNRL